MEQFLILTKRNLDVCLRDKGAVFFSFLSALIIIGLMVFLRGDMNIEAAHLLTIKEECIILTACAIMFLIVGIAVLKYQKKTDG